MVAALRLRVLGDLEVIRGGTVLELPPSKKTRGLLAYLALSERSMRREQLCELLWEIPDDPRGSLRWSLSKIRKLVDDEQQPRIIADRNSVGFDASNVEIDVRALHELVTADLEAVSIEDLERATADFQGSFLEGLELADFHDFHTWCIGQREKALRSRATLLRALVGRLSDNPERALAHASQLVTLLPYAEDARAQLIELLLKLDRKPEAEQQYRLGLQMLEEGGAKDSGLLYRAWRPRASDERVETAPPRAVPGHDTPRRLDPTCHDLVGREREVALLTQLVEQLPGATTASVLLIRGNPGMGKSSLLQLTAALARRIGAGILKARAFESERIRPFAVWNDALRRALPDNATSKLLSSGERITRDQAFSSLYEQLCQQTSNQPVVILFDDVQWCDESSVSALQYVLHMNRRLPFLLVAAARENEMRDNAPVQQALRSLRQDNLLRELHLQPLTTDELCTLIKRESPDVDARRLSGQCAGNPLLALELARAEAEGGNAQSLAELVQDRMSRLDPDATDLLLWAAVLSPRITVNTLAHVTRLERGVVELAIEAVEQQGMLHPGPRGFSVSHDLIARCIYQEITPAQKQVMHRRVAEMLEAASVKDLDMAADLAHHAARSGDNALAARAMISAGWLCLRFYANDDAISLYDRGMDFVAELGEDQRIRRTLELCDIRLNAGPLEDWQAAAVEYSALAEQAIDIGALSHARLGYQMAAYVRWQHGQWSDARRDSLQAERITRGANDEAHILGMAEAAKCLLLLERDLSQADAMSMEASALAARCNLLFPVVQASQGMLCYFKGRPDEAIEHLDEARALAKAQGDRLSEYLANEYLAMVEVDRGDYSAALARCQPLVDIGARLREGSEYPFAIALQALCEYGLNVETDTLHENLQALREADAKARLTYLLNRAAALDVRYHRFDKAQAHSVEAMQLAQLMERPTETLLAHLNLAAIEREGNAPGESEHLECIKILLAGVVAEWARQRAADLLSE